MVVAGRAAGGKRVAEPKAILGRDPVCDIGERRRAFVRRNDQVRVVTVVAHHAGRRPVGIGDDVVGQIEHAVNQGAIAGDDFGLQRLAIAGGTALQHEAPLGADRHDDRILDVLRFHEAENFRAKVLAPIGPTNAAAGHLAHAQMDPFHARRKHEDFEQRLRQR